jgi:electron transport complex protein RnfG
VPAWRLVSTLAAAGGMAGLAIVFVFQWAQPRIEAHRAAVLRAAIQEVLGGPESYRTIWVRDGTLTAELPAGVDSTALDRVYLGRDAEGTPVGFAIAGALPGYQDFIRLLFGYDAEEGRVIGMKVLESKETPGLGDKIEKDTVWLAEFDGAVPLLVGVKPERATGDEHEVDMISGATISSRTVINIINQRLEELQSLLDAYDPGPPEEQPEVAAPDAGTEEAGDLQEAPAEPADTTEVSRGGT